MIGSREAQAILALPLSAPADITYPHRFSSHSTHYALTLSILACRRCSCRHAGFAVGQAGAKLNRYGNPARLAPAPTSPAITPRDLQIRLYQFADDSMMGRQVGRVGNYKGTQLIAAEVKRLGLVPAGDNGTYFQVLPFHIKQFTNHSRLTVDGNPFAWEQDWSPFPALARRAPVDTVRVIFGGVDGDTTRQISAAQAAGKFVVLLPGAPEARRRTRRSGRRWRRRGGVRRAPLRHDLLMRSRSRRSISTRSRRRSARRINIPAVASQSAAADAAVAVDAAPRRAADSIALLKAADRARSRRRPRFDSRARRRRGSSIARRSTDSTPGGTGGIVTASLDFVELPSEWARNVVAIIPGQRSGAQEPVRRDRRAQRSRRHAAHAGR